MDLGFKVDLCSFFNAFLLIDLSLFENSVHIVFILIQTAARIKYGTLALLYRKVVHLKHLKDKTVGDVSEIFKTLFIKYVN